MDARIFAEIDAAGDPQVKALASVFKERRHSPEANLAGVTFGKTFIDHCWATSCERYGVAKLDLCSFHYEQFIGRDGLRDWSRPH